MTRGLRGLLDNNCNWLDEKMFALKSSSASGMIGQAGRRSIEIPEMVGYGSLPIHRVGCTAEVRVAFMSFHAKKPRPNTNTPPSKPNR
jgi:hypothetical protein